MCTSLDELHTRHQLSNKCKTKSRVGEKALEENFRKKYVLSEHFRYGMGQQSTVVMCTYHWMNSTLGISCQINVKLNQEQQLGRMPEGKLRESAV
jgi:hypothetical protein